MLEVRDLAVSYGDVQAVFDVSLEVAEGEIVTLLGSNGAGKTTTLRAIAGLRATSTYGFLDRAPKGRDKGDFPQLWLRRYDEYQEAPRWRAGKLLASCAPGLLQGALE